jgi:hypothetical protein
VLLVAKRDRLGRDVLNVAMIERLLERKCARVVSAAGEGTEDDGPTSILMRQIIVGRIRFTPRPASAYEEPGGYDFQAQTRFDKLFAGVAAPQLSDGSDLTGTDNISRAETWDADYARLLERAQKRLENRKVEWGSSPRGPGRLYTLRGVTRAA